MRPKDIIFHLPEVVMVDKVVGKYPEVTCNWNGCTTKWKDIIISFPETRMKEHKITTNIPEVTRRQNDIIIGFPAFSMELKTIIMNMPEIKLRRITVITQETEEKSKEVSEKYKARYAEIKAGVISKLKINIEPPHSALFDCIRSSFEANRTPDFVTV